MQNREKVIERVAKKYKENPDISRERARKYYQENRTNPQFLENKKRDMRRWIDRNPEKRRIYTRNSKIRAYGISPERYHEMLKEQGNCCAICEQPSKRAMSIDHDHKTGKVRGLLCDPCNLSLGHIEKDGFLEKALKYIARYK